MQKINTNEHFGRHPQTFAAFSEWSGHINFLYLIEFLAYKFHIFSFTFGAVSITCRMMAFFWKKLEKNMFKIFIANFEQSSLFTENVYTEVAIQNRSRFFKIYLPADVCVFKVNTWNSRKKCEICSKLTIKIARRRPGVFTVNSEHIPHLSTVSIFDFEQVIVCWEMLLNITSSIWWLLAS